MKHRRQNDKTPNDGIDSSVFIGSEHHLAHYEEWYLKENGVYPDPHGKTHQAEWSKDFKDLCELCEKHLFTKRNQVGYLCLECERKVLIEAIKSNGK